jgi:hypothetical protein
VVEHQAVVEPLPFGRVEQERLALPDAGGQAVDRLAPGHDLLHHDAGLPHGGDRLGGQRHGFAVPGGRDHLRNSQVTSVEHDRHGLLTHL